MTNPTTNLAPTDATCYEVVICRARAGVTRERMLAAASKLQAWVATQPGYVSRTLLEAGDSGQWIDIVAWRSEADAKAAAEGFFASGCLAEIEATMDADMTMLHATPRLRA